MNDFTNKYKQSTSSLSPKKQGKEDKKGITKALHQVFKMAMEGQVAGLNHGDTQYVMMRQDVLQQFVQNGGQVNMTPEQKLFRDEYQVLLHIMQKLDDTLDEEVAELFTEIDSFTFDFSDAMNGNKKDQALVLKRYQEMLDKHPKLRTIEQDVRKQLYPKKPEGTTNGKLT